MNRASVWLAVASLWATVVAGHASDGTAALPTVAGTASGPIDDRDGDGSTSEFYRPIMVQGAPGTLIGTEGIAPERLPSEAARGVRILYVSTDGLGGNAPIAVSGQILFPKSTMPDAGWPVVAWEHGTTGIADVCAPSWRGYSSRDRAYLNRWLDEGFAIVGTDYQGLGTPGPHPYLLFRPEGYSVLDGLRAAIGENQGTLRNEIIMVGQSQGSGAALGAAWLWPRYASDLHVIGVIATGLVADFATKADAVHPPLPVDYSDPEQMDAAYAMLRVEGTDHSLHPGLDTRSVMTPAGIDLSHIARTSCLIDLFKRARTDGVAGKDLFSSGLAALEAGETEASRIPDGRIDVPVFAGTGLADNEASLPGQYNAVAAMCDAGTHVSWHLYPGLTHNGTVNGSLTDSVPFAKGLLAGDVAQGTCAAIPIPGPVQAAIPGVPFNN